MRLTRKWDEEEKNREESSNVMCCVVVKDSKKFRIKHVYSIETSSIYDCNSYSSKKKKMAEKVLYKLPILYLLRI